MTSQGDGSASEDPVPSHVLVPLDGSPLADDALDYALAVFDCQITVLNVLTPLNAGMSESGILETDEDRLAEAQERAETLIEAASVHAQRGDRTVETAIETGDPAETILSYIDDSTVDHIVMGSHGEIESSTLRRLLGTVATTVVGESPVPVTVIR